MVFKSIEEEAEYRKGIALERERRFWKQVKKQRKEKALKLARARKKGILKATPKRKLVKKAVRVGLKGIKTSTKALKKGLKKGVKTTSKLVKHISKLPPYVPAKREVKRKREEENVFESKLKW